METLNVERGELANRVREHIRTEEVRGPARLAFSTLASYLHMVADIPHSIFAYCVVVNLNEPASASGHGR